jgi:nucleotide-binding universal stress UspA family protein
MKVLIAYDGSDCANSAIQDLRRAGLPAKTEALVLTCADLLLNIEALASDDISGRARTAVMFRQARALAQAELADARQTSAEGAELLSAHFPEWNVTSDALVGSPYAVIVEKSEQWGADLIVVGSHGRSALGRLILGSVSQMVLSHAMCSVRVGRCRLPGTTFNIDAREPVRTILAIDLSPDSASAIEAVRIRQWPAGSEIRIVTAIDAKLLTSLVMHGAHLEADPTQDAVSIVQARIDAVQQDLRDVGLAVDSVVLEGDPKRSIVAETEKWGADGIFVGARGHNRLSGFLLGSVSGAVAARARCSVEVVRTR